MGFCGDFTSLFDIRHSAFDIPVVEEVEEVDLLASFAR